MSRGRGRVMVALLGALRGASGPLAFDEVAIGMNGSKTVTRFRRGRARRVVVPAGDTANLRRALRGLVRRGDVVVIGDDALTESVRGRHGKRYAISDRSTRNVDAPAKEVTGPSLPPKPVVARRLPANDVPLDGSAATGVALAAAPAKDPPTGPDGGNFDDPATPLPDPVGFLPPVCATAANASAMDFPTSSGAGGATQRLVQEQREANPPEDRRTGSPGPAHLIRTETRGPRHETLDDAQQLDDNFARTDSSSASLTAADRRFLDFLARTALRIVIEEAKLVTSSGETEPSKEQ